MSNEKRAPAISVIVPIYNVEVFLRSALDSLLAQTFTDYEVIMVNDGSTDSCPQIMAEYSDRYSNFISIHQENQGLSAARNTGLQHATGEFVSFFDSDDRLAPTFLQELYEACQRSGADIACCNHIRYYPRNGFRCPVLITARSGVYSQKHALNTLLRDMFLHHFAWNKLCRRSIFVDNNITFTQMYFEDIATSPKLFYYTNRVAVVRKWLYYYTKRKGSILGSMNVKKINDYICSFALIRNFLEQRHDYAPYRVSGFFFGIRMMICNWYSVIRIHVLHKNFRGLLKNLNNANRSAAYYMGGKFRVFEGFPVLPYYVTDPVQRVKKEKQRRERPTAKGRIEKRTKQKEI
ncbi:MAG TPA: glycosyltransferase [Candidatus Gallacutalibacter stercoravium]|nr:glycosyltransferase [Candidatus Gallacutalibacter stercoravium]